MWHEHLSLTFWDSAVASGPRNYKTTGGITCLVVSHVCDCIFQMKPIRMPIDFSSHILLYKDGFNEKYNFFAKLIKQKVRDAKNPAHT